jgi:hypothetical protein
MYMMLTRILIQYWSPLSPGTGLQSFCTGCPLYNKNSTCISGGSSVISAL